MSRRPTIKSPHQDGQVGTEEVGEQDSRNDYGIADDDAFAQELVVVGAEVKLFAVVADAGEDEADEDTSLKTNRIDFGASSFDLIAFVPISIGLLTLGQGK